jgi:hypothetical protein
MLIVAKINDKEINLTNTTHVPQVNEIIVLYNNNYKTAYRVTSVICHFLENKNDHSIFTFDKAIIDIELVGDVK